MMKAGRLFDVDSIRSRVNVCNLLRELNWRVRFRRRADCGLCRGSTLGTIAFNERQWYCHRCHAGGDIFALLMRARGCLFPDAVRQLALTAGVNASTIDRRQFDHHRQLRERCERGAATIQNCERRERLAVRNSIHSLEKEELRIPQDVAGRQGDDLFWDRLIGVHERLQRELCVYTLLAFGNVRDRAAYLVHPQQRAELLESIRERGFVRDDEGRVREILQ